MADLGQFYHTGCTTRMIAKDAVHVAVLLAEAGKDLVPGEHIGVAWDGDCWVTNHSVKPIGIVDPFCSKGVAEGMLFYILIYPNTVMDMTHSWVLPCLMDKVAAKKRFEGHAKNLGVSYEELMEAAYNANKFGEHVTQIDAEDQRDYMYSINLKDFWLDFAALSGEEVEEFDHSVYSCSC